MYNILQKIRLKYITLYHPKYIAQRHALYNYYSPLKKKRERESERTYKEMWSPNIAYNVLYVMIYE